MELEPTEEQKIGVGGGFRSQLQVAHVVGKDWQLTAPVIYEGKHEFFVIAEGFETDFASIPRPLRWLFDNAGRNAEAGVLHDVLWRASKAGDPRIDAWNADALFRRALRQTGATALTRGVMWAAVRAVAILDGRFGSPSHIGVVTRVASLVAMAGIGLVSAGPAFLVVAAATFVYWVLSWLVALAWRVGFEQRNVPTHEQHWPWPRHAVRKVPEHERLDSPLGATEALTIYTHEEGAWLRQFPTFPLQRVTTEQLEAVRTEFDTSLER